MQQLDEFLKAVIAYLSRAWLVPAGFIAVSAVLYSVSGIDAALQTLQGEGFDFTQKNTDLPLTGVTVYLFGYLYLAAIYSYISYRHPAFPLAAGDFLPLGRFWRLFWANFLAVLSSGWRIVLLSIPLLVFFVIMSGVSSVVSGGQDGTTAGSHLFAVVFNAIYAWVWTRYLLVGPMAVRGEGRAVSTSRALTSGQSGELFLPVFVALLPSVLGSFLVEALSGVTYAVGIIISIMLLGILSNQQYVRLVESQRASQAQAGFGGVTY
jgi:hypothetical protein